MWLEGYSGDTFFTANEKSRAFVWRFRKKDVLLQAIFRKQQQNEKFQSD